MTGIPLATSVKVGGLDPGTSYTFKVQAANGSGSGPLSAAVQRGHAERPDGSGRPDGPGDRQRRPANARP